MLEQKRFFHARMTPSESLMATDGALKLNYASVIFVDPGVQIDETQFSYHSCCVPYTRSLVVYISACLWLSAHKTLVYSIRVSQGSVAMHLRWGGIV